MQELADQQRPGTGYDAGNVGYNGLPMEGTNSLSPSRRLAAQTSVNQGAAAGGDWILFEFNQVKERMTQMERKAEALWHVQVWVDRL